MVASTISLCQSSISNFITSFPSQASELAVNAVNNFIEDQVANPKKFERNISRVQSVFSRRILPQYNEESHIRGRSDGGGDCPNEETKLLLTLPRKVRYNIWQYLDDKSVRALRLVCKQLKHEMDYEVGLFAVLTTASFKDPWIKSISIRSCAITQMDTLLQLNHLARPEKLEKICFASEMEVDVNMIELIIRKFRNLRQLTIFTEDVAELKHFDEDAVSKGTSSQLFTRLEDQFQLTCIDVKFDTTKWKLKWNIKLKPQTLDTCWEVQDVVGHFGFSGITRVPCGRDLSRKSLKTVTLSIPFVQNRDRCVWLKVLQTQNVLTSLTCDLNATHWKEYAQIIQRSRRTLQKLFLLNLTGAMSSTCDINDAFDWKLFGNCQVLEEVTLIADTFLRTVSSTCPTSKSRRYMNSVNISSLQSCPALRAMWLENFKLSEEDVKFLKKSNCTEESLDDARFELCTLKNCLVGSEEVPEVHIGRKKERNRSLESLCFGTTSYNDDDIEDFEKYTASRQTRAHKTASETFITDWDMIDYFQNTCGDYECERKKRTSKTILEHFDIIGGLALTAWLYWC